MDEIAGTVKNVIPRKVKSCQFMVYFPPEISEAVTKCVPSIQSVYLPEKKKIEPDDISVARNIDQTLKWYKLETKCIQNDDT